MLGVLVSLSDVSVVGEVVLFDTVCEFVETQTFSLHQKSVTRLLLKVKKR